jgi:hypothetical protein
LPKVERGRRSGVAWFRRSRSAGSGSRSPGREELAHLEEFARTRRGVEGFLEPRTTVTETTLILIAHDGEWTRRRVASINDARRFCHRQSIPVYDVALVGYPNRMREYNARQKSADS